MELATAVASYYRVLDRRQKSVLWAILREDMNSEYDARFLNEYLHALDIPFSEAFWQVEREWASQEEAHFRLFFDLNRDVLGMQAEIAALEERVPDFEPIAHLFADEFRIACLGAYDELATVRAYKANLPHYDLLGPEFARRIRRVIADEAEHYHLYLQLILEQHADRLDESEEVLQAIRDTEGVDYGATFLLDHDDEVFTEAIYDESIAVLLAQLRKARARGGDFKPASALL